MSYQALYRKFRPSSFEDVKGQEHIVTTLKNQMKSGRIGHAYLFCGTRGTGKTTIAKILARGVNCENPVDGSPCGECAMCKSILAGTSMNVIELDAASNNGVDNIREIVDEVSFSPAEGKYKVYIIDEVHMLSNGAFNALLKTLEEPPSYVIFILATTEANKIPITILSRCQRYDFKRISIDTIADRLSDLMQEEGIDVEEKAIRYVAKAGDGSMRDALSLLDQCIAFHYGQTLTYDMVLDVLGAVDNEVFGKMLRHLVDKNVLGAIALLDEIMMQGRELTQFVSDLTWYFRNLLLLKTSDGIEDVIDVSSDNLVLMKEEAQLVSENAIMRYIRIFSELSGQLRYASQKRIMLEMAIIKICRPATETKSDALLERIRDLEKKLETGQFAMPQGQVVAAPVLEAGSLEKKEKMPLPKAIPEDVKAIVSRWGELVSKMSTPTKVYLSNAKASLGTNGRLLLVFSAQHCFDQFNQSEAHQEELKAAIGEMIGKDIEIGYELLQPNQSFDANYVDLSALINMQIEEEDD